MAIPVIDLFAGPGGLAEGFSAEPNSCGSPAFQILLSLEKDFYAHQTLEMRAFVRQFGDARLPDEYYDYVAGNLTRDQLLNAHVEETTRAREEAWLVEVGSSTAIDKEVDKRIRRALGNHRDWLLIGGPPCQAYSLVGRSRIRGASEEQYQNDHRHFLYREYLAILARHKPAAFVMENVKGLLSTRMEGALLVDKILEDLRSPAKAVGMLSHSDAEFGSTYRLYSVTAGGNGGDIRDAKDFVVRAEDYGIPQARHRIIIVGVRSDIEAEPGVLRRKPQVSIEETIGDLPALRSGLSREPDSEEEWRRAIGEIADARWLDHEKVSSAVRREIVARAREVPASLGRGAAYIEGTPTPVMHKGWYSDPRLKGILNHQSRSHMRSDLHRYFFAAVFALVNGRSPTLVEFPKPLLPAHENVDEAVKGSKFNDRFRVQVQKHPATTVVAHISKDGHYFIHYDPAQCRSLTVREAARLQTFPDNYVFEGPRTEQYRQVGNAVPPLLAKSIAKAVLPIFG